MDKSRDVTSDVDADEIRPLNARSLALSALLGTHPPRLPARALVALAELFGIADGTMRTALSRLVSSGEILVDDGRYRLAGKLLDRQRAQDTGRRAAGPEWDGTWHTVVVTADRRRVAERRAFRQVMTDHRMGELRPEVWMRPANLARPGVGDDWIVVTGPVAGVDPKELVGRLWDLDAVAERARRLISSLAAVTPEPDATEHDPGSIPARFEVAAAVLRFLRTEPLLPPALVGDDWPVDRLRASYARSEAGLQASLRAFFRDHAPRGPTGSG